MAAGWLSTHVLDTARGRPAGGIAIRLFRVSAGAQHLLAKMVTNQDGRTEAPMLAGAGFRVGVYELVFSAGEYLRASGQVTGEVLFLDEIPIRFGVTDEAAHYHVPLLLSGYGYATYRGS